MLCYKLMDLNDYQNIQTYFFPPKSKEKKPCEVCSKIGIKYVAYNSATSSRDKFVCSEECFMMVCFQELGP